MKNKIKNINFKEKYGPYALVAGGSDGLGAAYAEALACRGLNLVLIARRKDQMEATAVRLKEKYNIDVKTIAADLAEFEKTKDLITKLKVQIGLLVYNAAYAPIGLFENISEEQLSMASAVNVRAPLLLAKLLSAPMILNKRGGIILMSSLAGAQGSPKLAAYAATKAFNAVLAEGLWKELKPHGINVIGCCAGAILTPGYQAAVASAERTAESEGSTKKAAPGALQASDVAEITIKALGKRPVVIPGVVNKIARFVLTRLVSRKAAINIMSKNTGGLS
ncbi:MAG: SDR family NAD(P)-dependent oxidoreductase [Treponema sp.]|nr:SDR family NAD(P)-dependent oxidoreductase [Treponema sp.]